MAEESDSESQTTSLQSVARGASFFAIGQVVNHGFEFLINLILTHSIGVTLYGIYAYTVTVLKAIGLLTPLGTDKTILKYVPSYEDNDTARNEVVGLSAITSVIVSVIVASLLFIYAPLVNSYTLNEPILTDTLKIAALVIPINALLRVIDSAFRSLEMPEQQILLSKILKPTVRLSAIAVAAYIGWHLTGIMGMVVLAGIATLIVGIRLLSSQTDLNPAVSGSEVDVEEFYRFSIPLGVKDAGSFLYKRADILMVGIFLTGTDVAIYNVAILLTGLLSLPLSGINQLFPSIASKLYSSDSLSELETVFTTTTRWVFTITLFLSACLLTYRHEVLSLFSPAYVSGGTVLSIVVLGQLINSSVGPSAHMLLMTDHERVVPVNQWTFGLLNVGLNWLIIDQVGVIGAAIATALSLGLLNIVRVLELRYFEGITPFDVSLLKPIVATGGSYLAMETLSWILNGLVLILVGSFVGFVVFASLLVVLGIDDSDRRLMASAIARRSSRE